MTSIFAIYIRVYLGDNIYYVSTIHKLKCYQKTSIYVNYKILYLATKIKYVNNGFQRYLYLRLKILKVYLFIMKDSMYYIDYPLIPMFASLDFYDIFLIKLYNNFITKN